MWFQKTITLAPKPRGFHLITDELTAQLPELVNLRIGLAHLFILHTSASLTVNENCDPDVRADMEAHFNHTVPELAPYYRHLLEGSDDMPAHIKSSSIGCSVTIPIAKGGLALGTWQGVYLGEHRDQPHARKVLVTLQGE